MCCDSTHIESIYLDLEFSRYCLCLVHIRISSPASSRYYIDLFLFLLFYHGPYFVVTNLILFSTPYAPYLFPLFFFFVILLFIYFFLYFFCFFFFFIFVILLFIYIFLYFFTSLIHPSFLPCYIFLKVLDAPDVQYKLRGLWSPHLKVSYLSSSSLSLAPPLHSLLPLYFLLFSPYLHLSPVPFFLVHLFLYLLPLVLLSCPTLSMCSSFNPPPLHPAIFLSSLYPYFHPSYYLQHYYDNQSQI